jgi:hypothetical protein
MPVLLLLQLPPEVEFVSELVVPAQIASAPEGVIAAGIAFTVTVAVTMHDVPTE